MSNEFKKLVINVTTNEKTLVNLSTEEISQMETDHSKFLEIQNSYVIKRVREYPSIGDQLDDLFHAGLFSEEMTAKLQAIKDKYPKS